MIALLAGSVGLAFGVYPHHLQQKTNPDVIDNVFASRTMVLALRMAIVYVVVFVLASVAARIWKRQWLRRAGPFEISEEDAEALARTQAAAGRAEQEIVELKEQLTEADSVIEVLYERLEGKADGAGKKTAGGSRPPQALALTCRPGVQRARYRRT